MALIVLHGILFKNEESKDVIPESHLKTDVCQTYLCLIFLSLFVSWNYLLLLFIIKGATLTI